MQQKGRLATLTVAYAAVSTALVTVTGMIGITLPGGYLNFGDTMILVCSSLFGPVVGAISGGLGAFFTDLAVYPATMWYTLVIKAIEGLLCGLLVRYALKPRKAALRVTLHSAYALVSSAWMALGYFFTQWLMWGTKAGALAQLPWDVLQAVVSCAVAIVLIYGLRLNQLVTRSRKRVVGKKSDLAHDPAPNEKTKSDPPSDQDPE